MMEEKDINKGLTYCLIEGQTIDSRSHSNSYSTEIIDSAKKLKLELACYRIGTEGHNTV